MAMVVGIVRGNLPARQVPTITETGFKRDERCALGKSTRHICPTCCVLPRLIAETQKPSKANKLMISKKLRLAKALLIVAVLFVSSTIARSQSTVFYAPSTDVVGVQRTYLEADFITHLAAYKNGGYRIYGGRANYGVRKGMEAGVNVYFATSAYSPEPVVVQPNFKWQFYNDEGKGLAASAGVLVSTPVTHRSAGRTSAFLYAVGSKKIAGDYGPRFTAGAYHLAMRADAGTTKQGAIIGYEQPINRQLTFIADWTSGRNHLGYLAAGGVMVLSPRSAVFLGYSVGNHGRGNNAGVLGYGYRF